MRKSARTVNKHARLERLHGENESAAGSEIAMGYAMMKENEQIYNQETENRHELLERRRARKARRRYFLMQKLIGAAVIVLTVFAVRFMNGDATVALITIPLGLALIMSKEPAIMIGYFWEAER